jgi:integrase
MAKSFFTWRVGRAIIDRSPCEGVREPTQETPRDRVLTDDELGKVIRAAREIGGPYSGIVELLALTAQRRMEVARMTWDEVDLDNCLWTLPGSRTKNAKPHLVHLAPAAVRVLEARPKNSPYVFASDQKPFRQFSRAKAELDKRA